MALADIVKTMVVAVPESGIEIEYLSDDKDANGDEAEGSEPKKVLALAETMTPSASLLLHVDPLWIKLGSNLPVRVAWVNGNIDGFAEMAIGKDNVTNLEGNHPTRKKVGGFDLRPGAIVLDLHLDSKQVYEGSDGIFSVVLLVKTNGRVDKEKEDDTDNIFSVGSMVLIIRQGNGNKSSVLHDPGERIPHETEELG
ncbi:hypothetical protein H2248_011511 [Termitomyces sp. 'cryptogamus']|nr:hypothetical protein H2248_011511 [Termitomyces sp. 'cryptogamus']